MRIRFIRLILEYNCREHEREKNSKIAVQNFLCVCIETFNAMYYNSK